MRTFTIHTLLTAAFVLLATEQASAQPRQPIRVLAIGDSILHEARHPMLLALGSNAQTRVYSMPGSALCSFFDESLSDSVRTTTANNVAFNGLRKVVADFKPHAIVMQFWGNDNSFGANPCMQGYSRSQGGAYFTKYRTDTTRAMELVQLGARDGTSAYGSEYGIHFCPPGSRLDGTCDVHSSGALRYGFGISNAVLNKFPNGAPAATTPRYTCN